MKSIHDEEGVFGIMDEVDDALNRMETLASVEPIAPRKRPGAAPKKVQPKPLRTMPSFKINSRPLPKEAENVDFENLVVVPEPLLRSIAEAVDDNTSSLNRLLLKKLIPLMLSFETATNYSRAALKEGLNLEIDFDDGLADSVKYVGYLNVLFHFIRKSQMPKSVKQLYMNSVANKLAEQTVTTLVDANKVQQKKKLMQELQAVVVQQRDGKRAMQTHTNKQDNDTPAPVGVKRRRPK